MYFSEILILDGPGNYPSLHDKKGSHKMNRCNGKSSKKPCFLNKNGNAFITI